MEKYGGDQISAYKGITEAAQGKVDRLGIKNETFEEVIKLKGYDITVRGVAVDGKVRISTAYIP